MTNLKTSRRNWAAIAAALLGVTDFCHADGQTTGRPLKVLLSDFAGNQFVGSAVWHTDNVGLPGQQPTFAVRADIEIPDAGMTVRLDLRSNEDESFVELVFTLPAALPNGEIANVLGVLMKPSETARGNALNGVSVKVATNFFLIGLSSIGYESQNNVRLLKERRWLDVPIAYSTGKRANIAVEKPVLGDRAFAVLEAEAGELQQGLPAFHVSRALPVPAPPSTPPPADEAPQMRAEHSVTMIGMKPWPVLTAERFAKWPPRSRRVRPRLPPRPSWVWVWPGLEEWSWVPGSPAALWEWPQGRLTIADAVASSMTIIPSIASVGAPLWPHVRPPDFRIPMGRSHFSGEKNLEPPVQFVRWSNRIETVLPADEVNRRCRASVGNLLPSGKVFRGCARTVAGRCFIIRVDDPGIARHELAHCNGWQHPLP